MLDLTVSERMLAVHAAYGQAMLHAHGLELSLCTILSIHILMSQASIDEKRRSVSQIETSTLGGLIKRFVSSYKPDEALQEELDNMLFFRHELAHRISQTILLKAVEAGWQESLILELDNIAQMFRETSALLEPFLEEHRMVLGWEHDAILELGKRLYPGAISS